MFKNTAAKFYVFAFDATTNVPKTGDAANITAYVAKDYGAVTVLGDVTAAEQDATNAPGYYMFDAAQAETNGDILLITGKSTTANIKVIGAPAVIFTRPTTGWLAPTVAGRTLDVTAANKVNGVVLVDTLTTYTGNTLQTGDSFARIGAAGAGLTNIDLPNQTMDIVGNITGNLSGSVGSVTGAVGSVTAGVTLAASAVQAIWDAATSALTVVGSIGKLLVDNINATISSRSSHSAADVWAVATRLLTAGTNIVLAKGVGVTGFNDLSAAQVNTEADTALADVGLTSTVTGRVDVAVSSRAAPGDAMHVATVADGALTFLKFSQTYWDAVTAYIWGASVGANSNVSDAFGGAIAEIWNKSHRAEDVWDVTLSAHLAAGSTGFALNAAGSAGDPWGTALPGAYGAGTAGKIIGDNINATISSRLATAGYTAPDNAGITAIGAKTTNLPADPADASDIASSFTTVNTKLDTIDDLLDTEVAAIKVKTDLIPASPAAVGDIPTAVQNADALLGRNVAGGSSGGRTVATAFYKLRNKLAINQITNILTVYGTDDVTPSWTELLSVDAAAVPIVGSDPV